MNHFKNCKVFPTLQTCFDSGNEPSHSNDSCHYISWSTFEKCDDVVDDPFVQKIESFRRLIRGMWRQNELFAIEQ